MTSIEPEGWVYEVFASIQGEGLYCGRRQTFVRFAGCNLACGFCDTPAALDPQPEFCRIERSAGSRVFDDVPNPVVPSPVLTACRALGSREISITGGEPLMQEVFLAKVAQQLSEAGFRVHLETNGTSAKSLTSVLPFLHVIAMDMKLESATGCPTRWDEHRAFLKAARTVEVFVKTVVADSTTVDEISACASLVSGIDRSIPLVMQPVTGGQPMPERLLMLLQEAAMVSLDDVRVIPQCHKLIGLL